MQTEVTARSVGDKSMSVRVPNEGALPMSLSPQNNSMTLPDNERGYTRVSSTHASLNAVILTFGQGASPKKMMDGYITPDLADVYAFVTRYFHNQTEVEVYLQQRYAQRDELRRETETPPAQPGAYERDCRCVVKVRRA